ncbi:MAG: ubiquinone/menaquinone biosynthesis methyltransferase [Chloroflexota bacterium]|nr:ubiquinone/menaquinone biosynthesis methyltransferase [Chloroflexota bacterium]
MDETTGRRNLESANPADPPFSFADVAGRYDVLNRLMSLGCDRRWRRIAADALNLPAGGRALDVGAGSGDMALALLRRWPGSTVAGIEPVAEMMRVGRRKPAAGRVGWTQGDGLRLPFPDGQFDGVVSAFLLRNMPDVSGALAEQYRVARPGGRVVCLEMTWPQTPGFRKLFRFYFARLAPPIMGILSGQPAAYAYLPRSVQQFLAPEELKAAMERVGLRNVHYRMLMLGTVALHVGERGWQDNNG